MTTLLKPDDVTQGSGDVEGPSLHNTVSLSIAFVIDRYLSAADVHVDIESRSEVTVQSFILSMHSSSKHTPF